MSRFKDKAKQQNFYLKKKPKNWTLAEGERVSKPGFVFGDLNAPVHYQIRGNLYLNLHLSYGLLDSHFILECSYVHLFFSVKW